MKKFIRFVPTLMICFLCSCNLATMISNPTITPEPGPPADPATVCPPASEGTTQCINRNAGYCLLYPSDYTLASDSQRPDAVVDFTGPVLPPPPKSMDSISPFIVLEFNGSADVRDAGAYVEKWQSLFVPEMRLLQLRTTIAGQQAVIVNGIPGMLSGQGAFVIANGAKYLLMMFPEPGLVTDLDSDLNRGWDTIVNSLTFFPPQAPMTAVHAQDVCPVETTYGKPYINEAEGYCFLYPVDFVYDPQYGERFMGGPVLTNVEAFGGDIRETISVSMGGFQPDMTPLQTIMDRSQFIPAESITDMIINGYPAVAYLDTNGAWVSRQAHISVDGLIYSILIQPYEPTLFPQGILYANKAWDMVTTTLQFFEPWH
jgi:hypothetical protein